MPDYKALGRPESMIKIRQRIQSESEQAARHMRDYEVAAQGKQFFSMHFGERSFG